MELLWRSGQKQRALYRELAAVLAREYGTVPETETASLYEKIRSS